MTSGNLQPPPIIQLACDPPSSNILTENHEALSSYKPGGYHPVSIGDTFKANQYKVVHKLGWSGSSTVWLCRDRLRKIWVALKIIKAKISKTSGASKLSTWKLLHQTTFSNRIPRLLDHFTHHGPNGAHLCLVSDLMGPSLLETLLLYNRAKNRVDSSTMVNIAQQILETIAAIHQEGYSHGDISLKNIVFTIDTRTSQSLTESQLRFITGTPNITNLIATSHDSILPPNLPGQLIHPASWSGWIDEDDEEIRLTGWTDVGSNKPSSHKWLNTPESVIKGQHANSRGDLWQAGCAIFSLLLAGLQQSPTSSSSRLPILTSSMTAIIKDMPPEWKSTWRIIRDEPGLWYQEGDANKDDTSQTDASESVHGEETPWTKKGSRLEDCLTHVVPDSQLEALLQVIHGLVRLRPEERISASDAASILEAANAS